jgi:ribosomal protein S18 acetylase RimI-like enzyme
MTEARRATETDTTELIRLRAVMLHAVGGYAPAPGPWQRAGEELLRAWFADPAAPFAAFVVDDPVRTARLASCAVGAIDQRLPSPRHPTGRLGHIHNVATDPGHRRRGYSRACLQALLNWFDGQGVTAVDLTASVDGEALYASLGFARTGQAAMRRVARN